MKRRRKSAKRLMESQLEDLSNELLYEIFDYLDYIFLAETFAKFNQRFQSLFLYSSSPLKIYFPLTSKSIFESRCQSFITPNLHRIISLNISKYFLHYFPLSSFPSLQSLKIDQIQSNQISSILTQLKTLSQFSSLTIHSLDYFQNENFIYLSIFHLTKLKFCKLIFPSSGERIPLPLSTTSYSPLESLILYGHCRFDQLISILSYTPRLQHLSCEYLYGTSCIDMNFELQLKSLSLILYRLSFDELKMFLSKISRNLKKLKIQISNDEKYLQAKQWEDLIENSMTNLNIFDFHYSALIINNSYEKLIEEFSSKFWLDKKWFFHFYQYQIDNSDYFNFSSRILLRTISPILLYSIRTSSKINWD